MSRKRPHHPRWGPDRPAPPIGPPPRPLAPPILDETTRGLLSGNAMTAILAVSQHWPLGPILWVYWGQAAVIGVMNAVRMARLDLFTTEKPAPGRERERPTEAGKMWKTSFFVVHFGGSLAGSAGFVLQEGIAPLPTGWMLASVLANIAMFAWVHGRSWWIERGRDLRGRVPNIDRVMFYPYLRIVPMLVVLGLAADGVPGAAVFFIVMKALADVVSHHIELAMLRGHE